MSIALDASASPPSMQRFAPQALPVSRILGSGLFALMNGGETAVLLCFVFLCIAAAGAGPWSVDAARRRR